MTVGPNSFHKVMFLHDLQIGDIVQIQLNNTTTTFAKETNNYARFSEDEIAHSRVKGIVTNVAVRPDLYAKETVVELVSSTKNGFVKTIPVLQSEMQEVIRILFTA